MWNGQMGIAVTRMVEGIRDQDLGEVILGVGGTEYVVIVSSLSN